MTVLAVDIGGTKFAAAAVDADGTVVTRAEVPLKDRARPEEALLEVVGRVTDRVPAARLEGVGVGSAGPLDPVAGTVSPVNIPAWRGFPLLDTLGRLVPGRPVRLAGDGQCMALGEWWRGLPEGEPARAVLGVVVSTGVGGGFVFDGVPHLGPTGNAGHIGHIVVDPDGEPCPCGAAGCVETVASGPSMVRRARANGWTGDDARALAADARAGVSVAESAFRRAAGALAAAILTASALFDLDRVVIGGGVAAAGPVLLDPLRQAVARNAGLGFLHRLRVEATSLGRDAGLLGAAALVLSPSRPGASPVSGGVPASEPVSGGVPASEPVPTGATAREPRSTACT
ncbi:ROK family transcriptional regulator [Planomonospora sphaerica]|uniref:ROK family transcriptional regulator n=1 Tax=Planomonospora sphaerica TaxID=161355 RepID=A0A171DNT5_9ACTN|nr:ROK family protein [Planomonospora sphaerica]GAT70716.1 ROK family transcriptional regulator [Planomonospora sphaerica]